MSFKAGCLYENKRISNAYFAVTSIQVAHLGYVMSGTWLSKKTGKPIPGGKVDYMIPVPADWAQVKNVKFPTHLKLVKVLQKDQPK